MEENGTDDKNQTAMFVCRSLTHGRQTAERLRNEREQQQNTKLVVRVFFFFSFSLLSPLLRLFTHSNQFKIIKFLKNSKIIPSQN
jgi:hypothetical protein